ncbi:MAG: Gfo/Idh/MocA family oxidoreductase [Planctomycetes bacterium]|nr:Gfo/Idh/MocA family oxidoreductase [Planctomycetota bacterium]
MITLGIIGAGDWGKNLVRNFHSLPECRIKWCADLDKKRLDYIKSTYKDIQVTNDPENIFKDKEIQAVVISSSAVTHYPLAIASLTAGKHTYVEKPLALKAREAEEMTKLSHNTKRILMVGHLLKYHPAVTKMKEIIDAGELGTLYYIYSQRVNLGKVRADENAMWSFAPHDISVILYLLGANPVSVTARGESYLQKNIDDVVFVNMEFPGTQMAHIHISWLDPHKIRRITVVGSKKMAVFDDMEPKDKLKLYDRGIDKGFDYETYAEYLSLRFGEVSSVPLPQTEPLQKECKHFLECVKNDQTPLTDGEDGLRVVRVLEAAQESLNQKGMPVSIQLL